MSNLNKHLWSGTNISTHRAYAELVTVKYKLRSTLRPDSIELLFHWSFQDPFERVERDKNKKEKEKETKICWKYNNLRPQKIIFLKSLA